MKEVGQSLMMVVGLGLSGMTYMPKNIELIGEHRTAVMENGILKIEVRKGANPVMQYRSPPLLLECPTTTMLTATFKFSVGYAFASNTEKLPLGVYGGEGQCVSGGCPVDQRDGYSVRLIEQGGKPGLYIYDDMPGLSASGKDYGRTVHADYILQPNIDYKLEIGIQQAWATLSINGTEILREVLHNDSRWCASGILMTFMWGGLVDDPINWSPQKQSFTVRQVKLNAI